MYPLLYREKYISALRSQGNAMDHRKQIRYRGPCYPQGSVLGGSGWSCNGTCLILPRAAHPFLLLGFVTVNEVSQSTSTLLDIAYAFLAWLYLWGRE